MKPIPHALASAVAAIALLALPSVGFAAQYYSMDSAIAIAPSNKHITIQFDTTGPLPQESEFLAAHPCLDNSVSATPIARGCAQYGITSGFDFDSASAELKTDSRVNRCLPVYVSLADSAEIQVTDLVSVQFNEDVSASTALGILNDYGLHFVDSSNYRHMFWRAALDDTIKDSPLEYANDLHLLDETEWATPTMYMRPVLMALPVDSFFQNQYYLRNTGQTGGVADCDIDADSAWQFALADSNLIVAVIDEGGESTKTYAETVYR